MKGAKQATKGNASSTIPRNWLPCQQNGGAPNDPSRTFTIMTYNVLKETSATPKFFTKIDPDLLKFNYRGNNICKEIASVQPDIVCLQENDNYKEFYQAELSKYGYDSLYKQRGSVKDGCGTFYNRDRLFVVDKLEVEYNVLATDLSDFKYHTDNVALITLFQPLSEELQSVNNNDNSGSPAQFVLANTHLYWDPKEPQVRTEQIKLLWKNIQEFISNYTSDPSSIPIILCGDLNSTPDSEVIGYLSQQCNMQHSYQEYLAGHRDPWSLYIPDKLMFVDYIWFTPQHWIPASVLGIPDKHAIDVSGGLPSIQFSSDHMSVAAKLVWKINK